ncbi:unnamed protein product [Prunus armeniaca]
MEVYVNDMLVKAPKRADHLKNLTEAFSLLHQYRMKLNPSKCTFGVSSGRFLGYLVTQRVAFHNDGNIKPDGQSSGLQQIPLKIYRQVPTILQSFEEGTKDKWDEECEVAFQNLKTYLTSPPLLSKPVPGEDLFVYLAMSNSAVS